MRTNGTYRTPVHGVSTLAPRNRMRGQAGLQENFRSDPVHKLSRRPPSSFVGNLGGVLVGGDLTNVLLHSYIRNNKEYLMVLYEDASDAQVLEIYTDGILTVVRHLALTGITRIKEDVKLVTIEDTTFILNRKKVVQAIEVEDTTPVISYMNVISALNYGEEVKFSVKYRTGGIGSLTFNMVYTVPDLGDPPNYDVADKARATTAVAEALAALINSHVNHPIKAIQKGSVVAIVQNESNMSTLSELLVEIETGQGSRSLVAINKVNQDVEGLPLFGVIDSHVTIKPRPTSDRGTYYLKAVKVSDDIDITSQELTEVVWVETRSTEGEHKLDSDTLPTVVRQNGNTFIVETPDWEERETGDDKTNKLPSFVGKPIKDLTTHQNRLVVVSGNSVSMSRTDNLFNFFKQSAIRLLVTDPINVASTAANNNDIEHSVPHNKDIMFITNTGQFKLDGSVAVTPETVSLPLVTSYTCQVTVAPVGFGNAVLFPISYGASSGIMLYNKDAQVESDRATQITNHIQGMMQGEVTTFVADSTLEMAVVKTVNSPTDEVYVYEQYTEFDEAKQRSWSTWKFNGGEILDATFSGTDIIFIVKRGVRRLIERVTMNSRVQNDNDKVFLDCKLRVLVTLSPAGQLEVNPPTGYVPVNHGGMILVAGENCKYPLTTVTFQNGLTTFIIDDEDIEEGDEVIVGFPFTSRYVPTRPFRWTEAGIVVTTDKLRISRFTLSLVDTADVSMSIQSRHYEDYSTEYNSRLVGDLDNLIGVQPFTTGDVQFSFGKEADLAIPEFYTDGYLPLTIAGISWFGQYHEPSGRM